MNLRKRAILYLYWLHCDRYSQHRAAIYRAHYIRRVLKEKGFDPSWSACRTQAWKDVKALKSIYVRYLNERLDQTGFNHRQNAT